MPEITVIMPSYNVVEYIEECLQSVLAQSFQDMEILAVDAGSTDGTVQLIQEYARKDRRIKFCHSEQKSYGFQVNYGILEAKGEYIAIVETDDTILPDMMETLYRVACETGADYVKGDYEDWVPATREAVWTRKIPVFAGDRRCLYHEVICPSEYPDLIRTDLYLWRGLYRKEFLVQNAIKLNETEGAAFQDTGFQIQTVSLAQKSVYLNKPVYRYRRSNDGASVFSPKGFSYLVREYDYIEGVMKAYPEKLALLRPNLYGRLFDQTAGRVRTMAACGQIWGDIEQPLARIRIKLDNNLKPEVMGTQKWLEAQMFLGDPENYISYQKLLYDTKRRILCGLIESLMGYDQIILYSRSSMAGFLYCLIKGKGGGKVIEFCDNNPLFWQTDYMGTEVLSVEKAVRTRKGACFVMANAHYTPEMKEQLVRLGVPERNIFFCPLEPELLYLNM